MRLRDTRLGVCLGTLAMAGVLALPAGAAAIGSSFTSFYTLTTLPAPFGATQYNVGGMTFEAGNPNVLLIGGAADFGNESAVRTVDVTRAADGHITGYSGTPGTLSSAFDIDGGLTYGPGGDLFFTEWPDNVIGEVKPGDSSPDKTATLTGVPSSTGGLAFIPAGFPGAGNAAISSFGGESVCSAPVTPDGLGTYNFGTCANGVFLGSQVDGIAYVPAGTPGFSNPTMLVDFYNLGEVFAYNLDANGMPVVSSGQLFMSGVVGAIGVAIDPLTNDVLISEFYPGHNVFEAQSLFPPAQTTPEPSSAIAIAGLGIAVLALGRRRITARVRAR